MLPNRSFCFFLGFDYLVAYMALVKQEIAPSVAYQLGHDYFADQTAEAHYTDENVHDLQGVELRQKSVVELLCHREWNCPREHLEYVAENQRDVEVFFFAHQTIKAGETQGQQNQMSTEPLWNLA